MELDRMAAPTERDPRWQLGAVLDRRDLKVGQYIAGLDAYIVAEEFVYAPGQTFSTGLLGTDTLPKLSMTRRLRYDSMWGSHSGYLFPATGVAYNLMGCAPNDGAIVNGCQVPERVTLYIQPRKASLEEI